MLLLKILVILGCVQQVYLSLVISKFISKFISLFFPCIFYFFLSVYIKFDTACIYLVMTVYG